MLGRDLAALLRSSGTSTVALTRDELDIRDQEAVSEMVRQHRPALVINSAAMTNVDGCEFNEEEAFLVNAQGPENIARAAKSCGAFLVHVSTDYVFDGTKGSPYVEEDETNPLGVYGKSKAEGEARIADALPDRHCIVRTQWLFGPHGNNFVEAILKAAQLQDELKVVNDQWGCPTYTRDLARAIIDLCSIRPAGIVHATNSGETTWYGFAEALLQRAGLDRVKVVPISTEQLGRPAPRPAYSVLDNSRFRRLMGASLRNWEEALQDYFSVRETSTPGCLHEQHSR